jgi:UDP-N-acetylmuramyl tripeptide synthase
MEIIEKFIYLCANRRSDRPVIESAIVFGQQELACIAGTVDSLEGQLVAALVAAGIDQDTAGLACQPRCTDPRDFFCRLYAGTALALQQAAGHRVTFSQSILDEDSGSCRVIFEYEHEEVGEQAGHLALAFLFRLCPFLELAADAVEACDNLGAPLQEFRRFAAPLVLPADTSAIITAATSADIPWLKLDRNPFDPVPAEQRIRPNGALMLGHACYQHIVDGTFCVDRSSSHLGLIRNREQIVRCLDSLGLTSPTRDREFSNCSTLSRARRSAVRIGYPVVLKSTVRQRGIGVWLNISDESALCQAFEEARSAGQRVLMERHIPGETFRFVMANGLLVAVVLVDTESRELRDVTSEVHPTLVESARRAAAGLEVGMLVLTFVSTYISKPAGPGGAFVSLDVAPELDAFLPPDSAILAAAASLFLKWVFHDGAPFRIPLIAVTGTNGKTTTSRMIRALFDRAGYATGLACSEGVYLDGPEPVAVGDLAGVAGHFMVLASPKVNCAILETARGGVLKMGYGFDHCDISVCLNVTADHLEECGIDTVEQMAEVKRSIVRRARSAVILNADDPLCLAMAPFPDTERLCLVSMTRSVQDLRALGNARDAFAVIEAVDGENWVVIYDRSARTPIVPVMSIPATFGGLAEYNLANILHACAAGCLSGISVDKIREGITGFEMSFENTPGRLNVHDRLPYRVVLDYAHNPDGIARFCTFIDRLPAQGRRIVAFSAAGYNPDHIIRANARAVAGHFDLYWCYNFPRNIEARHCDVPETLRDSLLQCGVPGDDINVSGTGLEALEVILDLAREGDLVAFLSGHTERRELWERITRHGQS